MSALITSLQQLDDGTRHDAHAYYSVYSSYSIIQCRRAGLTSVGGESWRDNGRGHGPVGGASVEPLGRVEGGRGVHIHISN